MEVLDILDMMEDVIDKSMGIPFVGRAIVNREEMLELIDELRLNLPDDLKRAKWVNEQGQKIIDDAKAEAASIIKLAEEKMATLIDDHEITQKAYAQANEIVANAQNHSKEIRASTKKYVDDSMAVLEEKVSSMLEVVQANRRELKK